MGRILPTATMRVYQFESTWKQFAQAPLKIDREAFAELVAFAHFRAAMIAHAASPFIFEMILLTMLVGLVRRAEMLQAQGAQPFSAQSSAVSEFQTEARAIMLALRNRLSRQKHELYTFARALREEDQKALRALLVVTQTEETQGALLAHTPSDEMLLSALMSIMRRIRKLEKQYAEGGAIVSADDWSKACTVM